jgi:hypothetical protein
MTLRLSFLTLLFLFCYTFVHSQKSTPDYSGDPKIAETYFLQENYMKALEEYDLLYSKDSTNSTYRYRLGVCYLNTNVDKTIAAELLEYVAYDVNTPVQAWYDLGRAYQYLYRFDEAIKAFSRFGKMNMGKDPNAIPFERQIFYCKNAIELTSNPIPVIFINLGENVNSEYPEMNPFVTGDEGTLYYTSRKPDNIGLKIEYDGLPTADVFVSKKQGEYFNRGKRIAGPVNDEFFDELTWLAPDGKKMILYKAGEDGTNDVYLSVVKSTAFQKPDNMGERINSKTAVESAGCLSPDGKVCFFSSDRPGGFGKSDLYYSFKTKEGWSKPVNMGSSINTALDEDNPYLAPDGKTLYFCSQGHKSMGGYDLFKSIWNRKDNTFTTSVNLGYPINTVENNVTICFSESGDNAYIAALREGGYGNLDIYKIIFLNKTKY